MTRSKIKHFLVTIELTGPYRIHSYVMTDNDRKVLAIANKMADHAEKEKLTPFGVVLMTELSRGGGVPDPASIALVRKIACDLDPSVKPTLETAKDFHVTTWMMPKDHPSDRPLMNLH
jgi:hypothetical protein